MPATPKLAAVVAPLLRKYATEVAQVEFAAVADNLLALGKTMAIAEDGSSTVDLNDVPRAIREKLLADRDTMKLVQLVLPNAGEIRPP
jgi:hypothetical protein